MANLSHNSQICTFISLTIIFVGFCSAVYKKHYPPALNDEVWRLEKIGKDGSFHKRLNKAGILTVEDFLRLVVRDQQRLRNVRMLQLVVDDFDFISYLRSVIAG